MLACAVPTGLRSYLAETAFPTLKREANKLCAYGACQVLASRQEMSCATFKRS